MGAVILKLKLGFPYMPQCPWRRARASKTRERFCGAVAARSSSAAALWGNLIHHFTHKASPRTNETGFAIPLQGGPAPEAARAPHAHPTTSGCMTTSSPLTKK